MEIRVSLSRLGKRLPIAWKAALLGTNIVTDCMVSTALSKPARIRAPAAAVRFAAMAVVETFMGRVSTELMTWITPPSKTTSCKSVSDERKYIHSLYRDRWGHTALETEDFMCSPE